MVTSDTINEIATALAKAQGEMAGARKDSANPFFKSKYADLASVWDACRDALTQHGLAVVQSPSAEGQRVSVDTLLVHSSGQWMRGCVSVTAKDDSPQAIGSAITYLRRYALQSFVGVAPEEDDAEAAQGRTKPVPARLAEPKGYNVWLTDLEAVADEGMEALKATWKASRDEFRTHLMATNNAGWEALKTKADRITKGLANA